MSDNAGSCARQNARRDRSERSCRKLVKARRVWSGDAPGKRPRPNGGRGAPSSTSGGRSANAERQLCHAVQPPQQSPAAEVPGRRGPVGLNTEVLRAFGSGLSSRRTPRRARPAPGGSRSYTSRRLASAAGAAMSCALRAARGPTHRAESPSSWSSSCLFRSNRRSSVLEPVVTTTESKV